VHQKRRRTSSWRLWHGDAGETVSLAHALAEKVTALASRYPGLTRLVTAITGLAIYIENNSAAIAYYSERWDLLDCLRRMHHRLRRQSAFRQKTADAVVWEKGSSAPADPNPHR
jgi:hypothetical protein